MGSMGYTINPHTMDVLIDVVKASANGLRQELRNFAKMDVTFANGAEHSFFCHVDELILRNQTKLTEKITSQLLELSSAAPGQDSREVIAVCKNAAPQMCDRLEQDMLQNISKIGSIVKGPVGNKIIAVNLHPDVRKAEEEVRKALADTAVECGGLFKMSGDRIPQVVVTQGPDISRVYSGQESGSLGLSSRRNNHRNTPSADVIYLSTRHPPASISRQSPDSVHAHVFRKRLSNLFSHEVLHHFGLDELLAKEPSAMNTIQAELQNLRQLQTYFSNAHQQIQSMTSLENMAGILTEAGLLPGTNKNPKLVEHPFRRFYQLHPDRTPIPLDDLMLQLHSFPHNVAPVHSAEVINTLKGVMEETKDILYEVCTTSGTIEHAATIGQNPADEIAPFICSVRAGYGNHCAAELLPQSNALLDSICEQHFGIKLSDPIKLSTRKK